VVEDTELLRRPADWSRHEVLYLPVEVVVRLEPYGIQDEVLLKVLVDVGAGEGGVGPEVELPARVLMANQDISAKVTSDKPIIVERPMYFDFNGWTGGHDVVGFVP
jgi:hypothetical protein